MSVNLFVALAGMKLQVPLDVKLVHLSGHTYQITRRHSRILEAVSEHLCGNICALLLYMCG